ncbi:MAG: hypothetical protein KGV44_07780 [Flavobacteriaceae bacterium]|nr:hypothetical protein [Flavobacteriaceae bacterium]
MENLNIESELLKEHWDLIGASYTKALKKYEKCNENEETDEEVKYEELIDFLTEEWKRIYPEFVLKPYENKILDLFYSIQTNKFEKEKNIPSKITKFNVFYYLCQYFYIFVLPNLKDDLKYEDYPRFEIETNDENIFLRKLFDEIWFELNKDNEDSEIEELGDFGLFEFNEIEFNLLSSFLSKCWSETKIKTGSNVIATLSESTGVGKNYFLDEDRVLSDEELDEILSR